MRLAGVKKKEKKNIIYKEETWELTWIWRKTPPQIDLFFSIFNIQEGYYIFQQTLLMCLSGVKKKTKKKHYIRKTPLSRYKFGFNLHLNTRLYESTTFLRRALHLSADFVNAISRVKKKYE